MTEPARRAGLPGPRRERKRRNHLTRRLRRRAAGAQGTWWAPRRIGWWTGLLFAIGSFCFAVASLPGAASATSGRVVGITYFVGSIFFTSAGYLQYLEVLNADRLHSGARLRLIGWEPREAGYWAASIQSVGTLFFNVSTFLALNDAWTAKQENLLVWSPDALGSICFLVASWIAVTEVCGRGRPWWSPGRLEWDISWLNMVGSVFFGVSAVAAYVVPSTDELVDAAIATSGTLWGAVCFLVGAILLMPEARHEEDAEWLREHAAAPVPAAG